MTNSFWKILNKTKPICTETGNWDGKRSEALLIRDFNCNYFIGFCYETFINGEYHYDFYDMRDYEIEGVFLWANIPDYI